MAPRRPTMGDVAKLAACSQSTVSLVLNDIPNVRIGAETRHRVREAARALGYQAPWPRQNGVQTRGFIGYVVDRMSTSPEAVVSIDGAREAAWRNGHLLTVVTTLSDPAVEERSIAMLIEHGAVGLVYASIMTRRVVPCGLLRRVPAVLLNCHVEDRAWPAVVPGEAAGGQTATERLIRAGHERIAVINGEMWMEAARDRFKGYRKALADAGLALDPDLVRNGNWEYSSGYEHTRALLAMPAPPTAIFCANDRMAVGCYAALGERGLRVPQDMAVVGYDDQEIAQHLTPQLTTLLLPHREMGIWAIERLLAGGGRPGARHPLVRLTCPLVERDSVTRRSVELAAVQAAPIAL